MEEDILLLQRSVQGLEREDAIKLLLLHNNDPVECLLCVAPTSNFAKKSVAQTRLLATLNSRNSSQELSSVGSPLDLGDDQPLPFDDKRLGSPPTALRIPISPFSSPPQDKFSLRPTPQPHFNYDPPQLMVPRVEDILIRNAQSSALILENKRVILLPLSPSNHSCFLNDFFKLRREIEILYNEQIVLRGNLEKVRREAAAVNAAIIRFFKQRKQNQALFFLFARTSEISAFFCISS